ncbi:phosphatidylinositol-specific phospholipase C domain-containing protein [Mycoplasmopsis sturni]|uniref:phosphatidylinositol-specific phospholipase C domain-containing protein n=1 Tax=Mycoplasmopsis sturni TaxID=39047 RepID=UPI00056D5206|nr:phosphatidylinositol-specific phospholipase C domain-containing protein [Mycoplasmopsis sturni]
MKKTSKQSKIIIGTIAGGSIMGIAIALGVAYGNIPKLKVEKNEPNLFPNPGPQQQEKPTVTIKPQDTNSSKPNNPIKIENPNIENNNDNSDNSNTSENDENTQAKWEKLKAEELKKLKEIANNIVFDYQNKNTVYPGSDTNNKLEKIKLEPSLTEQNWIKIGNQKYKKNNVILEILDFSNINAVKGNVVVNFRLTSDQDGLKTINFESQKEISGFLNEVGRLNQIITQNIGHIFQDLASMQDKQKSASIFYNKLKNKLDDYLQKQGYNAITNDLHAEIFNNFGSIKNISFKLQSTLYANQVSDIEWFAQEITGFEEDDNEVGRLRGIVDNLRISYQNKENIIPYKTRDLNLDDLIIQGNWQKINNQSYENTELNAKIQKIAFNEVDPKNGVIGIEFEIESTRNEFEGVTYQNPSKRIDGFKTEFARVDTIAKELNETIDFNQLTSNLKNRSAKYANSQLLSLINDSLKAQNVVVTKFSDSVNNDEGKIENITFKLTSSIQGLNDVTSAWYIFNKSAIGFKNKQDLYNQINKTKIYFDYQNKANTVVYRINDLNENELYVESDKSSVVLASYEPREIKNTNQSWIRNNNGFEKGNLVANNFVFSNLNSSLGSVSLSFDLSVSDLDFDDVFVKKTQKISSFKTEVQRLNDLVGIINNKFESNPNLFNELIAFTKNRSAKYANEKLKEILSKYLESLQINAQINSLTTTLDNENGSIHDIKFDLKSTIAGYENTVSTIKTNALSASGFKTRNQLLNQIKTLQLNFDYKNKENIVPYGSESLSINNINLGNNWKNNQNQFVKNQFTIANVNFSNFNPRLGTVNVEYVVQIQDPDFRNVNWATSSSISGFKTEMQRLKQISDSLQSNNVIRDLFTNQEKQNTFASEITKNQILEKLNKKLKNQSAQILDSNLTISANNEYGQITLTYQINSTKANLSDLKSSINDRDNLISGFLSIPVVLAKLNSENITFDFQNKESILPEFNWSTQIPFEKISSSDTQWIKQDNTWINRTKKMKVKDFQIINVDPKLGELKIQYKIISTINPSLNIESSTKTTTIVGFKTIYQVLQSYVESFPQWSSLYSKEEKQRSAESQITSLETKIKAFLKTKNQNNQDKYPNIEVQDFSYDNAQLNNGIIGNINFKIASTIAGLTDVKVQVQPQEISGFYTREQERNRLMKLSKELRFAYPNKENIVPYEKASIQVDEIKVSNWNNQLVNTQRKAQVENITITEADPIEGDIRFNYTLKSKNQDFSDLSIENYYQISGFKTEQARLDSIISSNALPVLKDLFNTEERKQLPSSAYASLKDKINAWFTQQQQNVEIQDLKFVVNNRIGAIENISYKLKSTKIPSVISNRRTSQITINGFSNSTNESARLNQISTNFTINYQGKESIILYDSSAIQLDKLEIEGWEKNQSNEFVNNNLQAKLTNIRFGAANPLSSELTVTYNIQSTDPQFSQSKLENQTKTIYGFKTEYQRINEITISLQSDSQSEANNWFSAQEKNNNTNEEISKLQEKISSWISEKAQNVTLTDLTYLNFADEGKIKNISFKIQSTKDNLTNVKSTNAINVEEISGFKTSNSIKEELNNTTINFDYDNKTNVVPYFSNKMDINGLNSSLQNQGWNKSSNDSNVYNKNNIELRLLNFKDASPKDGTIKIDYTLSSTLQNFNSISVSKTATINGFETEVSRLNKLVDKLERERKIATLINNQQKMLPSQLDKTTILNKFNENLSSENATLKENNLTIVANDKNGTLTITYALTSKIPNNNDYIYYEDIVSKQNNTDNVIQGFKTNYDISTEKLNTQWNTQNIEIYFEDNQLKNTTTVDNASVWDKAKYKYRSISSPISNNLSANILGIFGYDSINGKVVVAYQIVDNEESHSNASGQKPTSKTYFKVIEGFLKEKDRINSLLSTTVNQISYTNTNKENTFPSTVLSSQIQVDNSQQSTQLIKIEDLAQNNLTANDDNGTLAVQYNYISTKTQDQLFKFAQNLNSNTLTENDLTSLRNQQQELGFTQPNANNLSVTSTKQFDGFLSRPIYLQRRKNQLLELERNKEYLNNSEDFYFETEINSAANLEYNSAITKFEQLETQINEKNQLKQNTINQYTNMYTSLNQSTKDKMISDIQNWNTTAENANQALETIKNTYQEINDFINNNIQSSINSLNSVKQNENIYAHAYDDTKQKYELLIDALDKYLKNQFVNISSIDGTIWTADVAKPNDTLWSIEQLREANEAVNRLIQKMTETTKEYNDIMQKINSQEKLTNGEKQALKAKLDIANSISSRNKVASLAEGINYKKGKFIAEFFTNNTAFNEAQKAMFQEYLNTMIWEDSENSLIIDEVKKLEPNAKTNEQIQIIATPLNSEMKKIRKLIEEFKGMTSNQSSKIRYNMASSNFQDALEATKTAAEKLINNENPQISTIKTWNTQISQPENSNWSLEPTKELSKLFDKANDDLIKNIAIKILIDANDLKHWMSHVNGNKRLSDLSIPGTHDSAMFSGRGIAWTFGRAWARTQSLSFQNQLNIGVRFFDIRIKDNDNLEIGHGASWADGVSLENVLNIMKKFLAENPSETVIIRMKDENMNVSSMSFERKAFLRNKIQNTLDKFEQILWKNPTPNDKVWNVGNRQNPTLNELRGKVFIMNNWHDQIYYSNKYGIYFSSYSQNNFRMQDFWDLEVQTKKEVIVDQWKVWADEYEGTKQKISDPNRWEVFINFTSMSHNNSQPWWTAEQINPYLKKYIDDHHRDITRSGIMVFDFVDKSLTLPVVYYNITENI